MTDIQVQYLSTGALVREWVNERQVLRRIEDIRASGTCTEERSGAFGHQWVMVVSPIGDAGSKLVWSIDSDEYLNGQGYPTHDSGGARIRGCELVAG